MALRCIQGVTVAKSVDNRIPSWVRSEAQIQSALIEITKDAEGRELVSMTMEVNIPSMSCKLNKTANKVTKQTSKQRSIIANKATKQQSNKAT